MLLLLLVVVAIIAAGIVAPAIAATVIPISIAPLHGHRIAVVILLLHHSLRLHQIMAVLIGFVVRVIAKVTTIAGHLVMGIAI